VRLREGRPAADPARAGPARCRLRQYRPRASRRRSAHAYTADRCSPVPGGSSDDDPAPACDGQQTTQKPQESYDLLGLKFWWPGAESNHRHADFQSAALPTELPGQRRRKSIATGNVLRKAFRKNRVRERFVKPAHEPPPTHHSPLPLPRSTPSCLSLRYKCVRSSPVFSATRVMLPFSRARWYSK
jgi:hypothetical protein